MMRYKIPTLVLILPIGSRKVYPGKKCCWKILGNALALFEVTGGKFAHHCWRRPSKNVAMTFFLFMMKIVRHVIGSTADFSTFFPSFFGLRERLLALCPEIVLRVFQCEICRIRTRNHCATIEPPHLFLLDFFKF